VTRREIIVELTRTLPDVIGTSRIEAGHGQERTSRVLRHSDAYYQGSYRELEAELDYMRSHARQHAVAGHPIGRLRWHYVRRYLHCTRRQLRCRWHARRLEVLWDGQWQPARPEHGHREPVGGIMLDPARNTYLTVEIWDPAVKPDRVSLALDWLDSRLPARLRLPEDWQHAA